MLVVDGVDELKPPHPDDASDAQLAPAGRHDSDLSREFQGVLAGWMLVSLVALIFVRGKHAQDATEV